MSAGSLRRNKIGNALGSLSILLAVVPVVYIFHPDAFPNHALTEKIVLLGGVGGSLLAAVAGGISGSGWWFLASVGAFVDMFCMWWFSP